MLARAKKLVNPLFVFKDTIFACTDFYVANKTQLWYNGDNWKEVENHGRIHHGAAH